MNVPLEPRHVVDTAARLRRRVGERFPASGLEKIAASLVVLAEGADARGREIARPHLPLRGAVWLLTGALLAGLAATFHGVSAAPGFASLADLLQGVDAAANIVLLLGAGVLSLSRLEDSIRRRKALALVHELKELAHVIDMHQLTKDPETVSGEAPRTESSPKRSMTRWELGRYLDYSSEMLSLLGKIGAIYGRRLQDAVVLEAIDGAEDLFTGLSRKIWQKIAILGENAPKA
ncbi:MAG: hypothetical protein M0D55_00750 [Elusimicrobiota bacterium]|nr:MAG: hypothetical protein M0D55_00750 [Elusimicrobiota bacterium]